MSTTSPGFFAILFQILLGGILGLAVLPVLWMTVVRALAGVFLRYHPLTTEAGFLLRCAHWLFHG